MWTRPRALVALALLPLLSQAGACAADTFVGGDAGDAAVADATTDGQGNPDANGQPDGATSADGGLADATAIDSSLSSCACTTPDLCCVYSTSQSATYSCAVTCAPASGGDQLSELGCTNTADCADAGNVCCMWRTSGVNQSACLTDCSLTLKQVQLCDPSSSDAGCPSNAQCSTNNIQDWSLPQTFATCGGQPVP